MKKLALIPLAMLPALALAAHNSSPAAKLITKLTKGQAKVDKSFSVGDNIQGFVVSPKKGPGRQMIMFATKDGNYLFAGNLLDKNGQNLTQVYTGKYISTKAAKKAINTIDAHTHYFTQGSDKAPHKAYVFFDPNCSACHIFYTEAAPIIKAGKLQVRWIPIAFLKASSNGKAALILSGKTDKKRAALLASDEHGFVMKTETGGLTAMKPNKSNKKYFDMVDANTKYFSKQGFYVTPTIVYKQPNGKAGYTAGAQPPGADFDKFLAKIGSKW